MEHPITIQSDDVELAATLHYPAMDEKSKKKPRTRWPLIIICHGFIGSRIGVDRLFVKAAREFSAQGFLVLRFDYGGCGESTGDYGLGGMDTMIDQTRSAIDYGLSIDCVDPSRVILLGHSLGGAIAILTAAKDKRVKSLILWSPVAHPLNDIVNIIGSEAHDKAIQSGSVDYLGYCLTESFFASLARHHPFQQVKKISGDVLLIHGTADELIPVDYCFLYQRIFWLRSEGQCDKEVILQANHTFSAEKSTQQLLEKTKDWLYFLEKKKTEWNNWMI